MSMAAALSNMAAANVFSGVRQHRARMTRARVATEEDDDDNGVPTSAPERGAAAAGDGGASDEEEPEEEEEEDDDEEQQRRLGDGGTRSRAARMSLADLEEERELQRRRSSACFMLSAFLLFRLWVLALEEGDFSLLLLCLVLTSWIARWIGMNRDREEELDRRIANYVENGESGSNPEININDFRMLSFQAQLALAIMESQRLSMQGGYHPENSPSHGVSEETRSKWERLEFKSEQKDAAETTKEGYGSLAQKEKELDDDEAPHCSICLSEYEDGETLTKLPCQHLYHDACILSWTESHINCPLCNFDLDAATGEAGNEPQTDSTE